MPLHYCKWFTVNKYVVVNECVPVYGLKFATRATKSDGQRKFPCFVQFLWGGRQVRTSLCTRLAMGLHYHPKLCELLPSSTLSSPPQAAWPVNPGEVKTPAWGEVPEKECLLGQPSWGAEGENWSKSFRCRPRDLCQGLVVIMSLVLKVGPRTCSPVELHLHISQAVVVLCSLASHCT